MRSWSWSAVTLGGIVVLVLGGCAGGSARSGSPVTVLTIAAPMHELVWSDSAPAVVGLTQSGSRIEAVDLAPGSGRSVVSSPWRDLGEHPAPGLTGSGVVYVPQPGFGQVAVLHVPDLRRVATLHDGPSPSYLALDKGAGALLALSEDGRTVTDLRLPGATVSTTQQVDAGPAARLDGPAREREVEFHVVSPVGITHYLDHERVGQIAVRAGEDAGDQTKVTRLYVAELGTDRLLAIDSEPSGDGLTTVGSVDLGEPAEYVGTDDNWIFVATRDQLVVLRAQSFGGFAGGRIPVQERVAFRTALPAAARGAGVAGLVVGPKRVYLSLTGQPYLVEIAKPRV